MSNNRRINDYGRPLTRDGAKFAAQLKGSRRAIARQGGAVAANVPETKQWRCTNCGRVNLERYAACVDCDEPREKLAS